MLSLCRSREGWVEMNSLKNKRARGQLGVEYSRHGVEFPAEDLALRFCLGGLSCRISNNASNPWQTGGTHAIRRVAHTEHTECEWPEFSGPRHFVLHPNAYYKRLQCHRVPDPLPPHTRTQTHTPLHPPSFIHRHRTRENPHGTEPRRHRPDGWPFASVPSQKTRYS